MSQPKVRSTTHRQTLDVMRRQRNALADAATAQAFELGRSAGSTTCERAGICVQMP